MSWTRADATYYPTAEKLMASVADSDDSAYLLSGDNRLLEVNAGYLKFARQNARSDVVDRWRHESVIGAVSGPLRAFFDAAWERVRQSTTPWEHLYECNSPELARSFRMTVYPVGGHLVVVHSLCCERPALFPSCAADDRVYVQRGQIRMCSNCRRVYNPNGNKRWDWVPAYVQSAPVVVSHGLCEPCAQFYWP